MKYKFASQEDKWTTVMEVAGLARKRVEEARRIAVKSMLEELVGMGALGTSIDANTGETLYRYDNTDPRASMIMAALVHNEAISLQ
jgi:hypothetical protein